MPLSGSGKWPRAAGRTPLNCGLRLNKPHTRSKSFYACVALLSSGGEA